MRLEADTISIDVPKGWVRNTDIEDSTVPLDIVQEEAYGTLSLPGISASYSSPSTYLSLSSPPPWPDLDIERVRDEYMEDGLQTGKATDAVALADRTIGGSPAYGYYSISKYHNGGRHPTQRWLVWREDGLWDLTAVGFEDETHIPPELLAALDTITWTIPTTTPEPTTTGAEATTSP